MKRESRDAKVIRPRRLSGDEGSVIVELALVSPFLILLVLGVLEFGTVFRQKSNLSGALQSAARIEAATGQGRGADYFALQTFYAQMNQADQITVNKVVIYRTTDPAGAPLSPTCFTNPAGSAANNCSVYTWAQVTAAGTDASGTVLATNFGTAGGTCAGTAWDVNWCPIGRNVEQADPPDYLGIYANVTYKSLTGLLPTTVTMTDQAVYRLDPKVSTS
jgi:hypothetical protein